MSESGVPDEAELDEATEDATEEATEAAPEAAFCAIPPTPPPPDRYWYLSSSNPSDAALIDPDNGECDGYVINARNVETMTATIAEPASDPDRCVGTSITMRRYLQNSDGSWSAIGAVTETGVWTFNGCRLPSISWHADTSDDARIRITTKRTYTPGQYTVRILGLKFQATANVFVQNVPN